MKYKIFLTSGMFVIYNGTFSTITPGVICIQDGLLYEESGGDPIHKGVFTINQQHVIIQVKVS